VVKPDGATAIYDKVLFRRQKTNIVLVEMMDEPHKAGEIISSMEISSAIGITSTRGVPQSFPRSYSHTQFEAAIILVVRVSRRQN
jgi:hypothetical protein